MVKGMAAVVAAVVLAGCGVGVAQGDRYDGPNGSAVVIATPQLRERRLLPTTVEKTTQAAPKRETVRGSFELKVPGGEEGASLSVMTGFAGCGISVEAVGTARVRNGRAYVRLSAPLAADSTREVFLTLDRDGDGRCTEVDTMWTALLTTGQDDVDVVLDLEELEAGPSWMCFGGWEE